MRCLALLLAASLLLTLAPTTQAGEAAEGAVAADTICWRTVYVDSKTVEGECTLCPVHVGATVVVDPLSWQLDRESPCPHDAAAADVL